MESSETAGERALTKLRIQLDLIAEAFGEESFGTKFFEDGTLDYLYVRGVILVRDAYLTEVARLLEEDDEPEERGQEFIPAEGLLPGVSLFSVGNRDVPRLLEKIDARLGEGIATPDHILSVTPVHPCPATEPRGVPDHSLPDPGPCAGSGSGTFIYVADTGLLDGAAAAHPWLAGVTGTEDPLDHQGGVTRIPEYAGHGTFIAGVARCMAPAARVVVTRDFDKAGAISEHKIVRRLREALRLAPDVINLSAGGTTRKDLPLLGFEAFWETYRHYKGLVLVASAGNNSTRRPFWPAAFPDVVGVGALAANGRARAYFSDYGPWVDVYAPGEDLVNAYATGTYQYREPPHIGSYHHFDGMARWSGTSFSAPVVAGLIAARVTRTGENGRQAASALLAQARAQHLPGVGPVLWPCDTGDCGDRLACCCGGKHAAARDCCC
jgi:subtilisin family serine protease